MMRFALMVGGCCVRPLEMSERPMLQRLLEACDDYYQRVYGQPARANEVEELLRERPPGLSKEQAHLCGLYDTHDAGDALIGVLDFLRDFPNQGQWYIGLLLVHPQARSQGLGAALVSAFETFAQAQGAMKLTAAVAAHADASLRFWNRVGFHPVTRVGPVRYGVRDSDFIRMEKTLTSVG